MKKATINSLTWDEVQEKVRTYAESHDFEVRRPVIVPADTPIRSANINSIMKYIIYRIK